MTSPVETIADALVAFILSLLRDPDAAQEFASAPKAMLAHNGLQDVCMADVASVKPVIVDHPRVVHHDDPPPSDPSPAEDPVHELVRMIQQYTMVDARSTMIDARSTMVDARSTIVDQSVNQNIWTDGGDVTQMFDQEAAIASGDHSVAAGDDITSVDSDVDVTVGDVSVGNETNDGSFNTTGTAGADDEAAIADDTVGADVPPADTDAPPAAAGEDDAADPGDAGDVAGDAVDTAVDAAIAVAAVPASVPEPADLLESDMTSTAAVDSYDADTASAALADDPVEVPLDDD